MTTSTFSRLEQIFHRAAALAGGEREAFLGREAERSPDLVGTVRDLLRAEERLVGRKTVRPALLSPAATVLDGTKVGPFTITGLLGHGGMGSVYRGERVDGGIEQEVAIKLLHGPRLDGAVHYRFRVESQVLARLTHPGIARLIDAGETQDGQPYLVMEYVAGVPITECCDRQAAPLRQRLNLFRRVCEAVSFAHRNLIVHRDLKPDHALVTEGGEVKLVDFGIAKPLTDRLGRVKVEATGVRDRMFTPLYAAPEQITGGEATVATDVWGLGLVLYELLCGARPFPQEGKSARQVEDAVLGDDPPPPSHRLASLTGEPGAKAGTVSAARLKGDLDSIVLKCLRKSPASRYATVDELIDDIDRFLQTRPVSARKGRLTYRTGKLFRRRWLPLTAAAAVAVACLVGGTAFYAQSVETVRQRDRARFVTDFIVSAFEAADPARSLGGEVTTARILEQSLSLLDAESPDSPDTVAELLLAIARVQASLGLGSEAWSTLERAQESYAAGGGDPELETRLLAARAGAHLARGEPGPAHDLATEILGRPGLSAEDELRSGYIIAWSFFLESDFEESRQHLAALLPRLERLELTNSEVGVDIRLGLGRAIEALGDFDQALPHYEEVLAARRRSLPAAHPALLRPLSSIQMLYLRLGRLDEARCAAEEILDLTSRFYGADSVPMADALDALASVESNRGQFAAAVEHSEAALAIYRRRYGENHKSVAMASFNLALHATQDPAFSATADASFSSAIAIGSSVWPEDHRNLILFRVLYGLFLNGQGRYEEAREQATRGLAIAEVRPEYRQYDFYALGELARSVADLALAPGAAKRREVERWLAEWEELPGAARAEAAAQARIAAQLGVAVPEGLVAAGDEGNGRGSPRS